MVSRENVCAAEWHSNKVLPFSYYGGPIILPHPVYQLQSVSVNMLGFKCFLVKLFSLLRTKYGSYDVIENGLVLTTNCTAYCLTWQCIGTCFVLLANLTVL